MTYTHLSQIERYQIFVLKKAKLSMRQIAHHLNRSAATISRELSRNVGQRGYRPKQAHSIAMDVASYSRNNCTISPQTWEMVELRLKMDWSPEQISGHYRVSHQSIYNYVAANKRAGGALHLHLRHHKKRRKRYGSGHSTRGQILNRVGIEQRPARVDLCRQVGDWEIDTIIGANHKHCIVSIVERKTGYALIQKLASKNAEQLSAAVIAMLHPIKHKVRTITSDNGKEFAAHQCISKALGCDWYFAAPYCSWQRGCNENYNGLVRQYLPKKTKLEYVSEQKIKDIQNALNLRPRKRLGFKTPEALFHRSLSGVALRV